MPEINTRSVELAADALGKIVNSVAKGETVSVVDEGKKIFQQFELSEDQQRAVLRKVANDLSSARAVQEQGQMHNERMYAEADALEFVKWLRGAGLGDSEVEKYGVRYGFSESLIKDALRIPSMPLTPEEQNKLNKRRTQTNDVLRPNVLTPQKPDTQM
ncbi:MAG TPA: hypothetical protein VF209_03850 [Patescibacteria group bacterium]